MDVSLATTGLGLGQAVLGVSNQQIALIALIIGISGLLLITTRRRIRQSMNSPQAHAREQTSRLRSEQALMQDMGELMAQLEQFSRQMQARLDTKFVKLECAIRDADQRIDALERLLRRLEGPPALDVTVDSPEEPAPSMTRSEPNDRHEPIYRLTDAGLTPAEIAEETGQSVGEIELIVALRKVSSPSQPPQHLFELPRPAGVSPPGRF